MAVPPSLHHPVGKHLADHGVRHGPLDPPDWTLQLIGQVGDTPERLEIRRRTRGLGAHGAIPSSAARQSASRARSRPRRRASRYASTSHLRPPAPPGGRELGHGSPPERPGHPGHPPRRHLPPRQPLLPGHAHGPVRPGAAGPGREPRGGGCPQPALGRARPLQAGPGRRSRPRWLHPGHVPGRGALPPSGPTPGSRTPPRSTSPGDGAG